MLTKDGSRTLNSEHYGETYHSTNGALTEARHVFLDATGVTQRLKAGAPTHVLEIGFGLGLNTLLSADLADQHSASLDYHSFENALVPARTLDELKYAELLGNPLLADVLREFVANLSGSVADPGGFVADLNDKGSHAKGSHATDLTRQIKLTLHLHDAATVDFKQLFPYRFHAIFLDAFSPDTNAECWSPQFIACLAQVLAEDGKLSTYSAKGAVRRAMLAAGLNVTKLPGPPGKREMLVAQW